MGPEPTDPDEILDIVDEEVREQGAIDDDDEPAAQKVVRRDALRSTLEAATDREADDGPNPS